MSESIKHVHRLGSCPVAAAPSSERQAPRHGHVRDALAQVRTDTHVDPVGKEHAHPELVIAGLDPITAQALLNDVASRVVHRQVRFGHGQRLDDLLAGYEAVIIGGAATDALLPGAAHARYGSHRVRLQQIVWPDRDGRFPWQVGYAYPPQMQPLLRQP